MTLIDFLSRLEVVERDSRHRPTVVYYHVGQGAARIITVSAPKQRRKAA